MTLSEIVDGILIEDRQTECKARLDRTNVTGWLKTIAGFSNADGGSFFIGVEDKTNKLIGFDRVEADSERNYFNNQVNEHISPRPSFNIAFLRYNIHDIEKFIIRVDVKSSDVKPVILKYNGVPAIYMRRDGMTNGATYEEIIEMSIKSKNTQYDVQWSGIKYSSDNFSDLQAFYSAHNNGKQLSEKALKSIGFMNEENILSNGAILFSDNYDDSKTAVQCSVFSGFTKGSDRIVTINRFNGNLIKTIEYCMSFVEQRMNHSVSKLGDSRTNTDAYPQRALFEGIINSIAHRDYYLDGTQIQIDMFRDRLEISSPGGFYRGASIDKTYNLSQIISKRRNEIICAVLVLCNVMEAAGTGFDKITEEYSTADDCHKPFIFSKSDHFTLVLPDLTYDKGIDDTEIKLAYPPVPNGNTHDDAIISFCYAHGRKSAEIAAHLNIGDSSYLRNTILNNLVETGYLKKVKQGRGYYYITNKEMVTVQ